MKSPNEGQKSKAEKNMETFIKNAKVQLRIIFTSINLLSSASSVNKVDVVD